MAGRNGAVCDAARTGQDHSQSDDHDGPAVLESGHWILVHFGGRLTMMRPHRATRSPLSVEILEGRSLLSGPAHGLPMLSRPALVARVHPSIQFDPAGFSAILGALNGGLGSEWVKLVRAEVHNLNSVI